MTLDQIMVIIGIGCMVGITIIVVSILNKSPGRWFPPLFPPKTPNQSKDSKEDMPELAQ